MRVDVDRGVVVLSVYINCVIIQYKETTIYRRPPLYGLVVSVSLSTIAEPTSNPGVAKFDERKISPHQTSVYVYIVHPLINSLLV